MFTLHWILLLFCSAGVAVAKSVHRENEDGPLDLTSYIERGEADKARKLSVVDPKLFAGVKSHAAYINVNKTNQWHTFFWFFPVDSKPLATTPWIIWLQGGPGGSSLYGLFEEIGPLKLENGEVSKMPVTWGSDYSLLFIDNPVHTGFSYSGKEDAFVTNENEVGECLLSFIQQFVQVFPELQKAPLIIAGESYAGKYVPAFGYYLHHQRNNSIPINLKGLVIADGWTDPPSLLHYSELALQIGFFDPDEAAKLKALEDAARKSWKEGNIEEYKKMYNLVFRSWSGIVPNYYNYIADNDDSASAALNKFLNQSNIRSALHVGNVYYSGILNYAVYKKFSHVFYLSVKPWLEDLLEHYPVLCYNGQVDFIVGYALSEHTYRSLNWSGAQDYLKARRSPIQSNNPDLTLNPIGYVKGAGNLMEVMIRSAGHMAPGDQPLAAKQVIDMFIDKFK